MPAFNSHKSLYLFLCFVNATLLLLILLATTHPPSRSTGRSFALHSHSSIIKLPARKMAVRRSTGTASHLHLSKYTGLARRSLLHLAEDHQEVSTTKDVAPIKAKHAATIAKDVAPIKAKHAATTTTTTTTLTNNDPHDHLPHHEVDVSATSFHVDYSGPKTHPPKNNR